jgi:hypothetical protein
MFMVSQVGDMEAHYVLEVASCAQLAQAGALGTLTSCEGG